MNDRLVLPLPASAGFVSSAARSLVEIVCDHACRTPDAPAFVFLKDGEREDGVLTFSMLDTRARAVAVGLREGLTAGDRAVLLFPSGLDFIVAFLGCLYAGVVAVPVSPPRRQQGLEKLAAIAANCGAACILTDTASAPGLAARLDEAPGLRRLPVRAVDASQAFAPRAHAWPPVAADRSTLAFLQYTSGSTGQPKGVAITHGNLLANEQAITEGFGHGPGSVVAGWLPFHHDMGLVGNILNPLYVGAPCVLMSPTAFAQQPVRWLRAVSRYRATTSGGPNFAYDLCVRRIDAEQMNGLDLSAWRVAFTGAEPVQKVTLDRFAEKFACVGFDARAFYPCYGMAEATLFVTGGAPGRGAVVEHVCASALERNEAKPAEAGAPGVALVGCGAARGDQDVLVVDPSTRLLCGDGSVGEIWIRGANVAHGYWNDPAATEEGFGARLAGSGDGPFLRTGDLGFLKGGELFITGRSKELIIIRGRKLYPHDIEGEVAHSHRLLDGCGGAAFSLGLDGEEKLVVVHEVGERRLSGADASQITTQAREAVARHFDVQLHELVLVRPGAVPRTSSGKTQRRLCRELYRQAGLALVEVRP